MLIICLYFAHCSEAAFSSQAHALASLFANLSINQTFTEF